MSVTDRRGATVLESGLCAGLFFALLVGIVRMAIVISAQQGLQTPAEVVARKVMTDQIASSMTKDNFHDQPWAQLPVFMKCNNLSVDIRKADDFASVGSS